MTNAQKNDENYLAEVRAQYENYPYPARDPAEEKQRLKYVCADSFVCANHYVYGGKRDFSKPMRVLIAGGGTGDSAVFMAEQLRDTDSEIIYVDISEASMAVAKSRAEARGLTNIEWHHASLLDVGSMDIGEFDYINCSGVLHHLEDPDAGLAAIASVLKDDGMMTIMVYGEYGRKGLYQMQELMRLLNKNEPNMQERVNNCKIILNKLQSFWCQVVNKRFNDIRDFGDVGVYDLFLHSQDRAYTVPQLYEFTKKAGLHLGKMLSDPDAEGNRRFDPGFYIQDPKILAEVNKLSQPEQEATAELLHGGIAKHVFYATKFEPIAVPPTDDFDNVPCLASFFERDAYQNIHQILSQFGENGLVKCNISNIKIQFRKTKHLEEIARHIDGKNSLKEIFKKTRDSIKSAKNKPDIATLQKEFEQFYQAFLVQDCMFLRHKSVPDYKTQQEMQSRVEA